MDEEKEKEQEQEKRRKEMQETEISNKINVKVQYYKSKYGKNFDESSFRSYADNYFSTYQTLVGIDVKRFLKEKSKDDGKNDGSRYHSNGKKYGVNRENGELVSRGSDGTVFRGKNFAELTDKLFTHVKQQQVAEGKNDPVSFKTSGRRTEQDRKIFCRAALKHGLVIGEGYSTNPKFWKQLKSDYLKDPKHTESEWNRLTSNVPSELTGHQQEKGSNVQESTLSLLKNLRKGHNPNLSSKESGVVKPHQPKLLTAEQLRELQNSKKLEK